MLMGRSQKRGGSPGVRAMRLWEAMGLRAEARRISIKQEGHLFHGTGTGAENSASSVGLVAGIVLKTFPSVLVT